METAGRAVPLRRLRYHRVPGLSDIKLEDNYELLEKYMQYAMEPLLIDEL